MAELEIVFQRMDETINFGARADLEEIVTVAVLRSSEAIKALDQVKITSQYQNYIFVSINKILRIIKHTNVTEEIGCFEFNDIIDAFCVSPCGKFILIATQDGQLTIKSLTNFTTGEVPVVFEEKLDDLVQKDYIKHIFFNNSSFFIVTSNGLVKKITLDTNEGVDHLFKSEVLFDFKAYINICSFGYPYLCIEGAELSILNIESKICSSTEAIGLKMLHAVEPFFVGFNEVGNIYRIFPHQLLTMCINRKFPQLINCFHDYLFLVGEKGTMHVIGITKETTENTKKEIRLMTYPELNVVYSIPLKGPAQLMNIKNLDDGVLFFTKIFKNDVLSEIRLQTIVETDPEVRVAKLIHKQLFDEAEVFAKTFNVSLQIIAQAKAQNIATKTICTTKDIDDFLSILDTIDDKLFKLDCCDTVSCELGTDTRRVLSYGVFMNIDVRDCNENKSNPLLVKQLALNDKLHRFDTFMLIYDSYDPHIWNSFVEADLIHELLRYLQKGETEKASVICSRFDRITLNQLTTAKIKEIFCYLNKDSEPKTFIRTLKYVPEALEVLVKWLNKMIFQMEKKCPEFPDSAIKFVDEITELIDSTTPVISHFNIEDLQNLKFLLKALKDYKMILDNFGIHISLADGLSNPCNIIRSLFNLCDKIKDFDILMADYICPFFFKNHIDMDHILEEEIEKLFVYEEDHWIGIVSILLDYISIDKKLSLTYKILNIVVVPWSTTLKTIAQKNCKLAPHHPLARKIAELLTTERILLIMRKYDIPMADFNNLDDKLFYFNRILYLNEPSAYEDIYQLCTDDEIRKEADLLIINKLIERQHDYEKAMNILDKNSPEKINVLCKEILFRCLFFATSYDTPKKWRDPYFVALNLIWNRIKKHATNAHDKSLSEFDYKIAYGIYGIYEDFKVQVKGTAHLITPSKRDILLSVLIYKAIDLNSTNDTLNFETFMLSCKKLALYFDIDLETVLMKCLKSNNNFNPFLRIGQYLLDTSKCSKLLSCWALYLFKYLKTSFIGDPDDTLVDVFSYKSKPDEDYLLGIELAKKLSIKAMTNADSDDHWAVMDVVRWIDTFFYISNRPKHLNTEILQIYPGTNLGSSIKSIEAVKLAFQAYSATLGSQTNPNTKYLTYFTSNITLSEDQLDREFQVITWNIDTLLKEGQYLTCFNVIKTIQRGYSCNSKISVDKLKKLQSIIETNWLPSTLEAVLSYRYIDKNLLLHLMLLFDPTQRERQLLKYLQVYKRQPHKLSVIIQVALVLCEYHKNEQVKMELTKNLNLCKWWFRIKGKGIPYESFFRSKCEDRLEALISAKKIQLDSLPEYCVDFDLDLQKVYLKYLEITIKCWRPKIVETLDGNEMVENENELIKDCQNILKYIKNMEQLRLLVEEMWQVTNYYYYEVFMALLSIESKSLVAKSDAHEAYRPLLVFLKSYKRVSSPSRSEIEQWFGTFPLEPVIDPLSKFRLPLTGTFFSTDIWTIIKPEVNLDTYKDWFTIVPILKPFLNENDICTYAINSAHTGLSDSTSTKWKLYPQYEHVIEKVEECAKNITDLERATAAVYTLVSNMAPGADKVKVAELSYKYAQMYRETASGDDVEKVYNKVKQRYFNYSATHVLHKYQLAKEEYVKLVAQPILLIDNLYNNPEIVKKNDIINLDCPDINAAVDELCTIFGLSSKKIKFSALSDLLKSDSTLDVNKEAENDCIKRACYICRGTDFHKHLLKIGMNKDVLERRMSVQANALKCLYYTSDINTLEAMSEMTVEQFLAYMKKVSVMAKLEEFGFKLKTVMELDQLNKKKLLRKLCEIDKPLAVQCVASICKIYGLDDMRYWEFIVNTAVRFNLIKDLHNYLEHIRFRCVKDFVRKGWEVVIKDALNKDKNTALGLIQKLFYFNRILYLNEPSAYEDIYQLCTDDEIRKEADLLIINKLIERQHDYEKAMNILDKNSPEKINVLCKEILFRCLFFATSYDTPKKWRDPYFVALNLIWNRIKKHATNAHDKSLSEFDYKIAYGIYGIYEDFKVQVKGTAHLITPSKRDILLSVLIYKAIDLNSTNDTLNFETFMLSCKKLALYFDIDLETVLMKCLKSNNNFNPFLRIGQYLLDTSKCSKLLSCWALYLFKYLKTSFIGDPDDTLVDVFSYKSKPDEDYLLGIELAKKLSIKAMTNADSDDHWAVMDVVRWIDTFFYISNRPKHLNTEILQIYPGTNLGSSIKSIEAVKLAFQAYSATLGSQTNPNTKYLTYFTSNITLSEDQLDREFQVITWNIDTLLKEGQYLTCFNVIKTIQRGYSCNSKISVDKLKKLQSIIETNWLPSTLEAVLSYRYIDKNLLLHLMLLFDPTQRERQLLKYLQVYKRQPHKLSVIIQVALVLCEYHKNEQVKMELTKNLNLCKWWFRIKGKGIPYESFFRSKCEDRLEALISAKKIQLDSLPEYCVDFDLDLQKVYLKYLEITIKCWRPKIVETLDGNEMVENENELIKDCQNILKYIKNMEQLRLLVEEMWQVTNYYYYEVFMALLSIESKSLVAKSDAHEAYRPLLVFLKSYKRVSSPSRSEIEQWFGTFPLEPVIDPLSKFRLPLTGTFFSTDIWTIIKPEVNLDTYKDWFTIVPILKPFLNENDICTYAINSAHTGLSDSTSTKWKLYPQYEHVIEKVEECAKNITDLERATAAVYTLVSNMAPGADKVKVAELSYKYAQMYRETASGDDVEKVYNKVKQRYFNYSATHVLHKYQLAKEEYVKLVAQPILLIDNLYNNPEIVKKNDIINLDCPDINAAVDELCTIFGLSSKKIKFSALSDLLKSDSTLDVNKEAENDCIKRACYICRGTDFHKHLLKIGMNKDVLERRMSVQANALKCLYYTSDINTLEAMSEMTVEQFLAYMKKVSVMAKLEEFGFKLKTVMELDQLNKKKLLRKLCEIDKPLAVQCVASICKIYGLDDMRYWEFIVNTAVRFNLIKDLHNYLEHIRFRCVKDFVRKGWEVVIKDALNKDKNTALGLIQFENGDLYDKNARL